MYTCTSDMARLLANPDPCPRNGHQAAVSQKALHHLNHVDLWTGYLPLSSLSLPSTTREEEGAHPLSVCTHTWRALCGVDERVLQTTRDPGEPRLFKKEEGWRRREERGGEGREGVCGKEFVLPSKEEEALEKNEKETLGEGGGGGGRRRGFSRGTIGRGQTATKIRMDEERGGAGAVVMGEEEKEVSCVSRVVESDSDGERVCRFPPDPLPGLRALLRTSSKHHPLTPVANHRSLSGTSHSAHTTPHSIPVSTPTSHDSIQTSLSCPDSIPGPSSCSGFTLISDPCPNSIPISTTPCPSSTPVSDPCSNSIPTFTIPCLGSIPISDPCSNSIAVSTPCPDSIPMQCQDGQLGDEERGWWDGREKQSAVGRLCSDVEGECTGVLLDCRRQTNKVQIMAEGGRRERDVKVVAKEKKVRAAERLKDMRGNKNTIQDSDIISLLDSARMATTTRHPSYKERRRREREEEEEEDAGIDEGIVMDDGVSSDGDSVLVVRCEGVREVNVEMLEAALQREVERDQNIRCGSLERVLRRLRRVFGSVVDQRRTDIERALRELQGAEIVQEPGIRCCGMELSHSDLSTLQPDHWLNDQVINCYLQLLLQSSLGAGLSVHITNTFFYTKLTSHGCRGVRRWIKNVDLSKLSLLLIPVHLYIHWCLVAVHLRRKTIEYYDSFGGRNLKCLKAVLKLVVCQKWRKAVVSAVHRRKTHPKFIVHQRQRRAAVYAVHWRKHYPKDIPRQHNSSDCGVFMCQYAKWLCRCLACPHSSISFSQAHMPQIRRIMLQELRTGRLTEYSH